MEIGLGHLRLPPEAFWRLSMREYDAAFAGLLEARGVRKTGGMTRSRLEELKNMYPDSDERPAA